MAESIATQSDVIPAVAEDDGSDLDVLARALSADELHCLERWLRLRARLGMLDQAGWAELGVLRTEMRRRRLAELVL